VATAGDVKASPIAKRMAREHGLDLGTIHGSGFKGASCVTTFRRPWLDALQ
jgi:pyruvate/2-oxoglutarate dehydrogenase complex dihydrolipoamide acyltransferase (E2) component